MIKIKCTVVPKKNPKMQYPPGHRFDLNTEQMRQAIEDECQQQINEGWTLRAMASRGGTMYCVFARKEK